MAMMRAIVAATRRGVKQACSRHRDARLASVGRCGKLGALRRPWIQHAFNARVVLAWSAGLALALAFPKPGWAGLAWVAPALMLLAGLGTSPKRAFRLGFLAGLTGNLIALHWLLFIPFPVGAVAAWLALSAYTALFPAMWVWLCAKLVPRPDSMRAADFSSAPRETPEVFPKDPVPAGPAKTGRSLSQRLTEAVAPVASLSWPQRTRWCLACAVAWVALEVIRAWLFTGFPWNFLGVSQYQMLPLIQVAAVTGVYGVSFLVAWGAMTLAATLARIVRQVFEPPAALVSSPAWRRAEHPLAPFTPSSPWVSLRMALVADLALPLAVLLYLTLTAGFALVRRAPPGPELKVALVHPSIPQRLIFDRAEATNRFAKLMDLTRLAIAGRPDLVVWPEASLPSFTDENARALTNLVASAGVWMVFGADDSEARPAAKPGDRPATAYFNAAFLFDPTGHYVATYRKRQLVIFGEYVPLARWLPFLRWLTPIDDSYASGVAPGFFRLDRPAAEASLLICYEDMYPALGRASVGPDTDFLLNLTNDGWFGESAEQWQHAAGAVFRAVENGLPLVRCANNGLTCWVDPLGRMHHVGFSNPTDIYVAGVKSVRIPLAASGGGRGETTFYHRHGDVFGWGCVALTALGLIGSLIGRRELPLATHRGAA